jgi:hypothetical protein
VLFAAITTTTTPGSTTPPTTVPAVAPCDDFTGRWEITHSDGWQSVLCINVDFTQNALVRGLWWNDTNEPFFSEILGRTRDGEYDEIGFSTMWADRQGVTSFAGALCDLSFSWFIDIIFEAQSSMHCLYQYKMNSVEKLGLQNMPVQQDRKSKITRDTLINIINSLKQRIFSCCDSSRQHSV